ncbi:hypothetical protein SAMN05421766_104683 [Zobellia uliginosa]|uniref:Uncharacterized protein n=1 Tax=Zobellia uliginosa TaxID=143224 RepID=A0ABY1L203_9FLAO|nr:hypothetical protein SAMN05421766_104683 [Zobellia uliginosa]
MKWSDRKIFKKSGTFVFSSSVKGALTAYNELKARVNKHLR